MSRTDPIARLVDRYVKQAVASPLPDPPPWQMPPVEPPEPPKPPEPLKPPEPPAVDPLVPPPAADPPVPPPAAGPPPAPGAPPAVPPAAPPAPVPPAGPPEPPKFDPLAPPGGGAPPPAGAPAPAPAAAKPPAWLSTGLDADPAKWQMEEAAFAELENKLIGQINAKQELDGNDIKAYIGHKLFQYTKGDPTAAGAAIAKAYGDGTWTAHDLSRMVKNFAVNEMKLDAGLANQAVNNAGIVANFSDWVQHAEPWQWLALLLGIPLAVAGVYNAATGGNMIGSLGMLAGGLAGTYAAGTPLNNALGIPDLDTLTGRSLTALGLPKTPAAPPGPDPVPRAPVDTRTAPGIPPAAPPGAPPAAPPGGAPAGGAGTVDVAALRAMSPEQQAEALRDAVRRGAADPKKLDSLALWVNVPGMGSTILEGMRDQFGDDVTIDDAKLLAATWKAIKGTI